MGRIENIQYHSDDEIDGVIEYVDGKISVNIYLSGIVISEIKDEMNHKPEAIIECNEPEIPKFKKAFSYYIEDIETPFSYKKFIEELLSIENIYFARELLECIKYMLEGKFRNVTFKGELSRELNDENVYVDQEKIDIIKAIRQDEMATSEVVVLGLKKFRLSEPYDHFIFRHDIEYEKLFTFSFSDFKNNPDYDTLYTLIYVLEKMNRDEVSKFFELCSKILHESKGDLLDYLDSVFAFGKFLETSEFFSVYNAILTDKYNLI